jgi:hypothetical protein
LAERVGEEVATEDELLALLKPCPDDMLKISPVGNMKNTGPRLSLAV